VPLPVKDRLDQEGASLSGHESNHAFFQDNEGQFHDVSVVAGLNDGADGRGFGWLDYDHDGRLDIALVNSNAPSFQLFQNTIERAGGSISIALVGETSNRDGIGAKVRIRIGDRTLHRERHLGEGFAAQNSSRLHVGLGDASGADGALVIWPSGIRTEVGPIPAGSVVTVHEGGAVTIVPR
jgi:enediyne biosynthesis protein E4